VIDTLAAAAAASVERHPARRDLSRRPSDAGRIAEAQFRCATADARRAFSRPVRAAVTLSRGHPERGARYWWLRDQSAAADLLDAGGWAKHWLFVQGADLSDVARLREIAVEFGLDAAQAEAVWNDPRWKARLKEVNDMAISAGVFGAPFFVIDGEPFWGNDRRAQIERWLASGPF
jgi:2-hydroxychromene-2-carboxylate isomerase